MDIRSQPGKSVGTFFLNLRFCQA